MGIRERLSELFLGDEIKRLRASYGALYQAYMAGPYELSPEQLVGRLKETDSSILADLVNQMQYEAIGSGYSRDGEAERKRIIDESRRLWIHDVITQQQINTWTNFGFGEHIQIKASDEKADAWLQEFMTSSRNAYLFGDDKIHELSNKTLVDGELFIAFFISTIGGLSTARLVDTKEIDEIVTDVQDATVPVYYKRVWSTGTTQKTLYYPDYRAYMDGRTNSAALPRGAEVAEQEGTIAVMLHIAHNVKQGLHGYPLVTAGIPWTREYKRFMENRAAVTSSIAMYVNKLKVNGGSRAVDAMRAKLQSGLSSNRMIDNNPPAAAGSTWLENQSANLERMPLSTGAGDAKTDGDQLLLMASLGGGMFPHWMGAGDAYRLATATAMEAPLMRQFSRYQQFWSAQFRKIATIVLWAGETFGAQNFGGEYAVEVSTDKLLEVDLAAISSAISQMFSTALNPYLESGLMPEQTARAILAYTWRLALQALGAQDANLIASDEAFGVEVAESAKGFFMEYDLASYRKALRAGFYGYWSGKMNEGEARQALESAIARGLRIAWINGMKDVGVDFEDITEEEQAALDAAIENELTYIDGVLEYIAQNSKANGGKFIPIDARLDLWQNRYNAVTNQAKLIAGADKPLTWHFGGTEEHCDDCAYADGKTYRGSVWARWGWETQSSSLECKGFHCQCALTDDGNKPMKGHPRRLGGR